MSMTSKTKFQIEESELETSRGKVIGIGRIKIPKILIFNYEIPLLSFIVTKKKDGSFVSTCIHLQMDGYGKTVKEARIDMVNNVLYLLHENFTAERYDKTRWVNLLNFFKANQATSILWDKYHAIQLMLAERGIATDRDLAYQKKIEELEAEVKKLKARIKSMNDKKRTEISMLIPRDKMIVRYDEPKQKKAA